MRRTHRDLLGVKRSYSTWCLSGMRGRIASNRGRRFGSLMTSFRSPTSTGRSMDLGGQKEHIFTRNHRGDWVDFSIVLFKWTVRQHQLELCVICSSQITLQISFFSVPVMLTRMKPCDSSMEDKRCREQQLPQHCCSYSIKSVHRASTLNYSSEPI